MRDTDFDLDACDAVHARVTRLIDLTPDPPCKGCPNYDACAKHKLVCAQFELYIDTVSTEGSWSFWSGATPTHRRYLRAYSGRDRPQGRRIKRSSRRNAATKRHRRRIASELRRHFAVGSTSAAELAHRYNVRLPVVRRYQRLWSARCTKR